LVRDQAPCITYPAIYDLGLHHKLHNSAIVSWFDPHVSGVIFVEEDFRGCSPHISIAVEKWVPGSDISESSLRSGDSYRWHRQECRSDPMRALGNCMWGSQKTKYVALYMI